ncbi:MAG: peptidoglycan-associated lipoprotein Pal [Candidatus Nitrohelix vancouverensis]|uniref:Peptidoglycan-associated protein n=1 Tax=Candidatus Nitrohelix vancouverensis TaxID=2705534 RepID=A0A7T0C056_9BACT|nr:MAG: peptidoglycan-associated lipoprotein Pal [Candidatus Nitrohelix vancouverensis]
MDGANGSFADDPQMERGVFSERSTDSSGNAMSSGNGMDSAGGSFSSGGGADFGGDGGDMTMPGDGYAGRFSANGGSSNGFAENAPGGNGSGNRQFKEPGDGYSGSFDGNGGKNGMTSSQMGEAIQEARLLPFKSTSNLGDVFFSYDKFDLDGKTKSVLDQNADYMKKHPNVQVEIQGHCDERGTNNYNIALGERRANAVKKYLMSKGVSGDRLHTISYGEEKPFCFESGENCWRENRRGHFMVSE